VAPERIVVTAGSSAALLLVLALLVNRDDEVLLADPNYPCNRHLVRTLEGRPVGIAVGAQSNYQLTAALVERHWTPHTRAALVATPSNPTGTTVAADEMARIAGVVAAKGGHLIVDEIYLGLTYGLGRQERPRSAIETGADAFVISSFSKHFNMTGWRLGWAVVPERHVRDLEKLAQNLYISPATPSQRAALACFLPETLAIVEARRREFEARRDLLVPALRDLGFRIPVLPTGGFFVYADTSALAADSGAFCREVLEATGVAFTPGLDFGTHRAGDHVRFAYTIAQAKIADGIERLARYLPTR